LILRAVSFPVLSVNVLQGSPGKIFSCVVCLP
jgi:hypothetical protein